MSAFLAVLPSLALVVLLAAVGVLQFRETRRGRRGADPPAPVTEPPPPPPARHPARRRGVPGLPVDGEPLSEEDLAEYTAIMMRPTTRDQGRRPR